MHATPTCFRHRFIPTPYTIIGDPFTLWQQKCTTAAAVYTGTFSGTRGNRWIQDSSVITLPIPLLSLPSRRIVVPFGGKLERARGPIWPTWAQVKYVKRQILGLWIVSNVFIPALHLSAQIHPWLMIHMYYLENVCHSASGTHASPFPRGIYLCVIMLSCYYVIIQFLHDTTNIAKPVSDNWWTAWQQRFWWCGSLKTQSR